MSNIIPRLIGGGPLRNLGRGTFLSPEGDAGVGGSTGGAGATGEGGGDQQKDPAQQQQKDPAQQQQQQKKPALDEDTQAWVEGLINKKFGEGAEKGRQEQKALADQTISQLNAQIAQLTKTVEGSQQQQRKESEKFVPVEDVQKTINEMTNNFAQEKATMTQQLTNMRTLEKQTRLAGHLVGDLECVNPQQVVKLVDQFFAMDEIGKMQVVDENGNAKLDLNRNGTPMTEEAFLAGWLAKNSHHLKSSAGKGAGSNNELHLPNGQTLAASDIAKNGFEHYRANRGAIINALDNGKVR